MELAKESLVIKRQVLEEFTDKGLYPYSRYYLRNIKSSFHQYWRNHFSTIGIIGMNDALFNLFGFDITEARGIEFSVKTLDFMRERLADFQEQTDSLFNLEATPAEGTSYRLADLDRQAYPDIKIYSQHHNGNGSSNGSSASTPAPYYTNSSQLPVGFTDDVFQALKLQDPLQSRYTGGTVLHCFVGEKLPSKAATIALVKTIAENFRLPYFTLTPTFSICGATSEIKNRPWGRSCNLIVRRGLDCWPCQRTDRWDTCRDHKCMNISPDTVLEAIESHLNGNLPQKTTVQHSRGQA